LFPTGIPDLKQKAITASKTANDILFSDEYAYYSCGVGIVLVNLKKNEITDTYIIGAGSTNVEVKSLALFGDSIYAFSASGLYVANKSNKLLVDYNNWHYRTNTTLSTSSNSKIVQYNGKLYLLKSSGVVYASSDAVNWTIFNNTEVFTGLRVTDNNLVLFSANTLIKYNTSLTEEKITGKKTWMRFIFHENTYWIASSDAGLIKSVGS
jgi:hypothetical protein